MKISSYNFIFILIIFFAIVPGINVYAQEQEGIPEHLKYFKETYEETYTAGFDKVLDAVKNFIESEGFRVLSANIKENDLGKQRAIVQSEICVLTQDPDSVFQHIKKHASKPPFIRGGVWSSARVQYRFIVNDKGDGNVSVLSRLEYTG